MAILTKMSEAGGINTYIAMGGSIPVYQTNAALGANGVYNTPLGGLREHLTDAEPAAADWIRRGAERYLDINAIADQASAANGLVVEESDDEGATARVVYQAPLVANTLLAHTVELFGRLYRVRLTNGATPQGSLSIFVEARK